MNISDFYKPCPVDKNGFCSRHNKHHKGRLLEISQMTNEVGEKYRLYWDGFDESFRSVSLTNTKKLIKDYEKESGISFTQNIPKPISLPCDLKDEICHIWTSKPGELTKHAWNKRYAQALALMTEKFVHDIPNYPENRFTGRGIVIAGGGKYFPSAYVTIRVIRHLHCGLPIQLWYFGKTNEIDEKMKLSLIDYGVEFVDADEVRKEHKTRMLGGFEIKWFGVQNSPFEEVLFLDADSYPVINPEELFEHPDYLKTGAVFFPDLASTNTWTKWDMFHVEKSEVDQDAGHETGQFLINKQKCWQCLQLANWYNNWSDITYKWEHGDKLCSRVPWAYFRQPYTFWKKVPTWHVNSYLHKDSTDQVIFVHRCRSKFKFSEKDTFYTPQNSKEVQYVKDLPLEDFCFQVFKELNDFYFSKADHQLPSTTTQIKNFASALYRYIASGGKNVTDEQYDNRMKTCLTCEHRTPDWRCKLCGCFLSKKALWASEKCPDNRWDDLDPKPETKKCGCGK